MIFFILRLTVECETAGISIAPSSAWLASGYSSLSSATALSGSGSVENIPLLFSLFIATVSASALARAFSIFARSQLVARLALFDTSLTVFATWNFIDSPGRPATVRKSLRLSDFLM